MGFWQIEVEDCKSIHVAGENVAVFTNHVSTHYISSVVLDENGNHTIILNVQGQNLDDDKVRIGFAEEGWQQRNEFKAVLGTTEDSWALSSGNFYHSNRNFTGPGFPKFQSNYAQIRIMINHKENKADFWLDNQNVNMVRDLPRKRFQIYLYLQNASIVSQRQLPSKNWAPSVLRFEENTESIKDEIINIHKKFIQEIRQSKKNKKQVNILLIGEPGVGKSSFINSIMTACSKNRHSLEDIIPYASVRDTPFVLGQNESDISCHTRKITCYRLPKSHVYLWDCFGMTSDGHTRYIKDFSSLMEGKLRPGFTKDVSGVDQPDYVTPSHKLRSVDRIHCVFVFVSAEQLIGADDNTFDTPREFIDSAQRLYDDGLRVIVILTKVDEIGKNQFIDGIRERKFNLKNVYKNPEIYRKAQLIRCKLGIGMNQVIPVQNYASSEVTEELNYFQELFHLRAVTLAMKYARIVKAKFDGNVMDSDDAEL